jgi:hypothetical protein
VADAEVAVALLETGGAEDVALLDVLVEGAGELDVGAATRKRQVLAAATLRTEVSALDVDVQ